MTSSSLKSNMNMINYYILLFSYSDFRVKVYKLQNMVQPLSVYLWRHHPPELCCYLWTPSPASHHSFWLWYFGLWGKTQRHKLLRSQTHAIFNTTNYIVNNYSQIMLCFNWQLFVSHFNLCALDSKLTHRNSLPGTEDKDYESKQHMWL